MVGAIPKRKKWNNIGVRWNPFQFANDSELNVKIEKLKNEKKDTEKMLLGGEFGGLSLFVDLKQIGFVFKPEENVNDNDVNGDVNTSGNTVSKNLQFYMFHSALKLEKRAISKVQKPTMQKLIFCNFKNGKNQFLHKKKV